MRYIRGFREGAAAAALKALIAAEVDPRREYHLMEFCGGHTHAIFRYGVEDLLPDNVRLVHGPGCPVCVLAVPRLDAAIELASRDDVTLVSYGDMLRVPASRRKSLLKARAQGADVRMAYSALEALDIAAAHPERQVVFFAIGFETTTPATAHLILEAQRLRPTQLQRLLQSCGDAGSDPEHPRFSRSARMGAGARRRLHRTLARQRRDRQPALRVFRRRVSAARRHRRLRAARRDAGHPHAGDDSSTKDAPASRISSPAGSAAKATLKAQRLVAEVLELRRSFEWRGLGELPYSGLGIKAAYGEFDAERRFAMPVRPVAENAACQCPAIIRGVKKPTDCALFGGVCTPRNPIGSCMVSAEGACAAYYKYRRGTMRAAG